MDAKISKIVRLVMYVLLAVSVGMVFAFYLGGTESITFANGKEYTYPVFTDGMIYWMYILFGLATVSSILFAVFLFIDNPKKAKGTLMGVGALALVVAVAYALASEAIPAFHNVDKFNITESVSKMVGTGLYTMYLLAGIAVVGILYTEISKSFK